MDISTFTFLFSFVQSHGYFVIFLIMILGGPGVTAVAAFVASFGLFNVYLILLFSFLGNIIGDLIYFYIGRTGRRIIIDKYSERFKINKHHLKKLESKIHEHPGKALTIIKVIPPLPAPGLVLVGAINMPLKKFLFFSVIISFFYSLFFVLIGYYLGHVYTSLSKYSNVLSITVTTIVLAIILTALLYPKPLEKFFSRFS